MPTTTERRCENPTCGRLLASTDRPDKRFCSESCRVSTHQRRRRSEENRIVPLSAELQAALEKATEETRLVAQVASAAAKGQWRASAWLLERKYPERWMARPRPAAEPEPEPQTPALDPFAEVDELAARRRSPK